MSVLVVAATLLHKIGYTECVCVLRFECEDVSTGDWFFREIAIEKKKQKVKELMYNKYDCKII